MVLFRLVMANFRTRPGRMLLTAAAVAMSVSLVVAVTTGYASIKETAMLYLDRYMGSADATIGRPEGVEEGAVPESLVDELARDKRVRRVTGRLELGGNFLDQAGKRVEKAAFNVTGIREPGDTRIDTLVLEKGRWFTTADSDEAVLDESAAQSIKVEIGDTFEMATDSGPVKLKMVGVVHKPELIAAMIKTVYLPLGTMQKAEHAEGTVSQISIDLWPGTHIDEFAADWQKRLAEIDAAEAARTGKDIARLKLGIAGENRGAMAKNLGTLDIVSYLAGAVSMLAATFIIFSALSMGVSERQRTLAMIRAVGGTRMQVAGMVVIEGVLLTGAGAAIGIALGITWAFLLTRIFYDYFTAGLVMSWGGVIFAAGTSLAAALAASLLPAVEAGRVSPMEAMSPLSKPRSGRLTVGLGIVGVMMILVDPIIFFAPWEKLAARAGAADPEGLTTLLRLYAHFVLGLPGMFGGFFLLAPLFVWAVEWTMTGVVSAVFGVPGELLRQQLSTGLWRAAGTGAALMVGLAVLIAMTTQGESLLGAWKLPDKFPDVFLVSQTWSGVSPEQQAVLEKLPEIKREADGTPEVFPVAITLSGLGSNPINLVAQALLPDMSNTFFFGAPVKISFDMVQLDFRDNEGKSVPADQQAEYAQRAQEALNKGRSVIVTEDYRRRNHVKYGDTITLAGPTKKYQYTICGIVWSPGLDVVVSVFDLGQQLSQKTSGMVIGSLEDAQKDFGVDHVHIFAANLKEGTDKEQVLKELRDKLGVALNMRAGDMRMIKAQIDEGGRRLLMLLSTVALAALGVASLGVTNTVMAGIRTRRWQFGVLRSIGLERGTLMRLVLAEASLLGLIGISLGLVCGAEMSIDAHPLLTGVMGVDAGVVVPWGYILVGSVSVMVVSLLASWGPAMGVARTEPLRLLQAGRAAT